ncbi:MAG: hypothetical protein HC859_09755 [Bacteroidia bacterium]|nr:hypothetical protein [Bacteroidia bacterium]
MCLIRIVSFVVLLGSVSVAGAQDSRKVDSLKAVLGKSENADKFDVLFKLFVAHIEKDNQSALKYSDEAYQVAFALGDSARIVKAGRAKDTR